MRTDLDTLTLLGLAVFQAQRLEFTLYALAAHASHIPEAQGEKRFRDLTPGDFLSQDPEKRALRKATLGQLVSVFGDRFILPPSEIEDLVDRRNVIVHDFWREVEWRGGTDRMADPKRFLAEFVRDCAAWMKAVRGLVDVVYEATAAKHGRPEAYAAPEDSEAIRAAFHSMVDRYLGNPNGTG